MKLIKEIHNGIKKKKRERHNKHTMGAYFNGLQKSYGKEEGGGRNQSSKQMNQLKLFLFSSFLRLHSFTRLIFGWGTQTNI